MSEIIVRGFKVGETCKECKLNIELDEECFCVFMPEPINFEIKAGIKSEYCPARNIQPHGELIDRDNLVNSEYGNAGRIDDIALAAIYDAPAVISASE